jgi:hypothetical protein
MAHPKPALAIVIASKNRWDLLDQCILSINRAIQATGANNIEIIVGISGEVPASSNFSSVNQVHSFPAAFSAPQKRNFLLATSQADWIFFCDDDVEVPKNIFNNFHQLQSARPEISVFGGPNFTHPNASLEEQSQGRFLSSRLTNPGFYPRYSKQMERQTQSTRYFCLCNLFVKKSSLLNFRHLEFCGEELQLLRDLDRDHQRFLYSPVLWVYHHRRKTRSEFLTQIYSYGRGRGQFFSRNLPMVLSYPILFVLWPFARGLGLYSTYFAGITEGVVKTLGLRYPVSVKRQKF